MLTADLVHVRRRGDRLLVVPLSDADRPRARELAGTAISIIKAHLGLSRGVLLEAWNQIPIAPVTAVRLPTNAMINVAYLGNSRQRMMAAVMAKPSFEQPIGVLTRPLPQLDVRQARFVRVHHHFKHFLQLGQPVARLPGRDALTGASTAGFGKAYFSLRRSGTAANLLDYGCLPPSVPTLPNCTLP